MKLLNFLVLILISIGCQVKTGAKNDIIAGHLPTVYKFTVSADNRTYYSGEDMDFLLSFPSSVTVIGSPRIALTVGSTAVYADYLGGSGTSTLLFRYIVNPGDDDHDGVVLGNTIDLNGGTLTYDSATAPGENCDTNIIVPSLSSVRVDTSAPSLVSVSAPANGTYYNSYFLTFTATFDETVFVVGSPRIAINVGGTTKYATYLSGSGSTNLSFRYTVTGTDTDNDGIGVSSPIQLNGGKIRDGGAQNSTLVFTAPNTSAVLVAGNNPIITNLMLPSGGTYTNAQNINFTVILNESVTVTGAPRLSLNIGGATRYANYVSGSGSTSLLFRYTVSGGDNDNNGINIGNMIDLNGGTIRDGSSADAIPLMTVPATTGINVLSNTAVISTITIPGTIPAGGFDTGENVDFTVTWSEPITSAGTSSRLQLTVGATTRYATYLSGSGTDTYVYRYTVPAGDEDLNGLAITSPMQLNGSTLTTSGGQAPSLTFVSPNTATVLIDAKAPAISSNTVPAAATYKAAQNLDYDVTFSEPVTITGTPRIALDIGGVTRYANYLSGSGTAVIRFRYVTISPDTDSDGITTTAAIELNGGTIADPKVHAAALILSSTNTSGVRVDTVAPTISSITPPANGSYNNASNLDFTVNWSENVTVTGTPRITLDIGGTTRYANYVSGSGTSAHLFRYTVAVADVDTNGIGVTSPLDLNGGTFSDSATNSAILTFTPPNTSAVIVAGSGPTIISVTPPSNAQYNTGDPVNFTVNFSEAVVVTLVPRIAITLSTGTVYATYQSGGGTSALVFRYTVAAGAGDTDGITLVSPLDPNGGAIQNLSMTLNADLTYTSPNTSGVLIDGYDPAIATLTPPSNAWYKAGENLDFVANYGDPVVVTGTPRIGITLGSSTVYADYLSGSGTNSLTFRYTVIANDLDANGIAIGSSVGLNGGSINDPFSEPANNNFTSPNLTNVRVDAVIPTISSVAPPADGTYNTNDNLDFTVNFAENIVVTGLPQITLDVGGTPRYAIYTSGTGTNALVFRYTVNPGHLDSNGIESSSPLDLNSGTLKDQAGNDVSPLTFTPPNTTGVIVDATAPYVISVTPPANATYKTTNNVNFTANFSKAVTVTGTPRLTLTVGASTYYANYISGSGTTALLFRYTVAAGHSDIDGLAVSGSIDLNSGTIEDSVGTTATVTFTPPVTTGVLIDGIDAVLGSITPPSDKTYVAGDLVEFTANFNFAVTITGSPRIELTVGGSTRYASYHSGSGTNAILFRWNVPSGNLDNDGINTTSNLQLNGGTITDAFGDVATITFTGVNYPNVKVDSISPTITSVTGPSAGTYRYSDNVDFTVTYSESVAVTGSPRIQLTVGSSTLYATYFSGSGTTTHIFRYTVGASDVDSNGIASSSPLQLNSGTLSDMAGNGLSPLTFSPPNTTAVLVDGASPYITSVTASANATYKTTNNIDFTVNWSSNVNVTGTPRIQLTVGAATLYANYSSGTGTTATIFRYTVGAGDSDANGIAMASTLSLNGGTIRNASLVNAQLTFTAPNVSGINVDGIDITISSVTLPADATYKIGDNLDFTVNYNYAATVTGTPRIQITLTSGTVYANYTSGSGGTAHVFRYTVATNDLDADGINVASNVQLNGGTIRDAFSDNATITFTGNTYANKRVDGVRPTVSSTAVSANATYRLTQNIDFTLTYSEAVTITGTPRIVLTVGSATRYANYSSGSGSTSIVFRYTVGAGDTDTDGIAATASIDLNSGTIVDAAGNAQTNLAFVPGTLTGKLVDGIVPTISSITPPSSQTYGQAAALNFTVTFSEAVTITGSPYLSLNMGGASKNAVYVSGSGSTSIVMRYTTVLNDVDTDGVASVSPLILSGGTIKDAAGNDATLTFSGSTYSGVIIDCVPPAVSAVNPPAANTTFQNGGTNTTMTFTVVYNENVNVVGTPRLVLTIGSSTVYANYVSGTGSSTLTFTYAVLSSQLDMNGIAVSSTLDLNGGTLRDAVLNNASTSLGSIDTSKVWVVFPSMYAWYDVSDSAAVIFSGSNVLTLVDKIGTYDLDHTGSGVPFTATGFNGGSTAYITCNNSSYFGGSGNWGTQKGVMGVFRTPTSTSNQYLYTTGSTTRPMVQLSTSGNALLGDSGAQFTGTAFGSNSTTETGFWTSSTAITMMRAVRWSTSDNRTGRLCQFAGQLSEFIFFDTEPTPAEVLAIEAQMGPKHNNLALP